MAVKTRVDIRQRLQFIRLKGGDIVRYAFALGLIERDARRLEDLRGIFTQARREHSVHVIITSICAALMPAPPWLAAALLSK